MKQSEFIKPDEQMKNNRWHTICFGWIMLAMEDNGESEMENASEANKILNYLIRDVRKEAQAEQKECHCHAGGNYKDCTAHKVLSCSHCKGEK